MVKHLTHIHKIGGSNPAPGNERERERERERQREREKRTIKG